MVEKDYIDRYSLMKKVHTGMNIIEAMQAIIDAPAADVVEVRQIRAFIDRLVAERDKYDLHSMRWERYDCDRLLIEQMLDEMGGGVNDGANSVSE